MSQGQKFKLTWSMIHKLVMIFYFGSAICFYFWNTPAYQIGKHVTIPYTQSTKQQHQIEEYSAKLRVIITWMIPDMVLLGVIFVIFVTGTGVFANRLDAYLKLRDSGKAQSLHSIGIEAQTLLDNKDRRGGIFG